MADIVCAWCGRKLGEKPGLDRTTYGICPACEEEQNKLLEEMIKEQNEGDQNDSTKPKTN